MESHDEILDDNSLENPGDVGVQQIISISKFIFLCIISFGLYHLWWTYKAWKYYQEKEKLDVSAVGRALFSIFYLHSLFSKILTSAKEEGYTEKYNATFLFVLFLFFNFLSYLPEPYWLISFLIIVCFIPPFKALNYAKLHASDVITNDQTSFSTRQVVLILAGIAFWALLLFGFYTQ